jgi:hypothetical protein
MTRPIDLLRQGRKEELWQMCCGFLDLSLDQFMTIQERLLREQLGLLKNCELGRKVMRGAMPETVEDFRQQVPLTTYRDYLPDLVEQREDVLPAGVAYWVRTSGKTGEYEIKLVPVSERFADECEKVCGGFTLLALCNERGDVSQVKEHLKVLYTMGGREYGSGFFGYLGQLAIGYDFLPSDADGLSFQDSIRAGFKEALYTGLDAFGGLPSVLVAVGEQFRQKREKTSVRPLLSHPRALLRLTGGMARSKLARRPLLPRDLWSIKGIVGGGSDAAVFSHRVGELWGRRPLEIYGGTEGGIYAMQTWDHEGMTFVPNLDFFEFIPEREWFKWQLDHSYQPKTVLLDEVKAEENYEVVITNFHGGALVRFRIGDLVRITSLRNEKLGIDIPQMLFHSRADDLMDIFGVGHITEKLVWQAIENTGIPYVDWVARKEAVEDKPTVHIYIELKGGYISSEQAVAAAVYDRLLELDKEHNFNLYKYAYGDAVELLGLKPINVTFLAEGAFASYITQRQAEGADLGHLKPPHINPSDKVLSLLRVPPVEVEAVPAGRAAERALR